MTDFPLVTIGITCYNAAATIKTALQSALGQDWPNVELVIVDDASSDRTVHVVQALVENQDVPYRLIRHEINFGVAAARNRILADAKGEFVAFFDDDDISHPGRLSAQVNRIRSCEAAVSSQLVVCYAARIQQFSNGDTVYAPTLGVRSPAGLSGTAVADVILFGRPVWGEAGTCATCSFMARRSVVLAAGGYQPALRRSEDTEFNLRFALNQGHFAGLAEPLVTQTMTATPDKQLLEEKKYALLRLALHQEYLARRGWYAFLVNWTEIKYAGLAKKFFPAGWQLLVLALRAPRKTFLRLMWLTLSAAQNRFVLAGRWKRVRAERPE